MLKAALSNVVESGLKLSISTSYAFYILGLGEAPLLSSVQFADLCYHPRNPISYILELSQLRFDICCAVCLPEVYLVRHIAKPL